MKTIIRALLMPVLVVALAATLAWIFIGHADRKASRGEAVKRTSSSANSMALRVAAIEAASRGYKVALEGERIEFERDQREGDFAELAELSHEVRLLRIELEHKKALAAIDTKYPPPKPVPTAQSPP